MTPIDRRLGAGLAIASGLALVIAAPPIGWWPLGWVFLAPLIYAIERAPTRRSALFWGWLAGFAANAVGFYFVVVLLVTHASLPWVLAVLALLLLAAYQAVVFWLFAAAIWGARRRIGVPLAALAPLAMVSAEMLVPFMFPWYAGVTQVPVIPVIQIAELTGPLGVTALTCATAGAVIDAWLGRGRRRWIPLGAAVGLALVAAGLGQLRVSQIDARRAAAAELPVGLVQANGAGAMGGDRTSQLVALQRISAELERDGAELIVWPEAVYPFAIDRSRTEDYPVVDERRLRRGFEAPLVAGALTVDGDRAWNSAVLVTPGGAFAARYDKMHLLAFGERVPLSRTIPLIRKLMPAAAGDFESGESVEVFDLAAARLGLMICYEDVLPGFGRELAPKHPQLLVNMTNDSWFGTSAEPHQHLALSVFRAVEMRTDLVRATINGVSAHVDAAGRVVAETEVFDPTDLGQPPVGLLAKTRVLDGGGGFFARLGNVFGLGCLLGLLGVIGAAWRRGPVFGSGGDEGGDAGPESSQPPAPRAKKRSGSTSKRGRKKRRRKRR